MYPDFKFIQKNDYARRKADQQVRRPLGKRVDPERLRLLAEAQKMPRVRVTPVREELRRWLRHPNGMGFRSEGSVEWPLDNFTHRRVRDGDIKIEPIEDKKKTEAAAPHRQHRMAAPQAPQG